MKFLKIKNFRIKNFNMLNNDNFVAIIDWSNLF